MRYTNAELHPVIFEKIKEASSSYMSSTNASPEFQKAMSKHSGIWFKEYWRGTALWALGFPLSIMAFVTVRGLTSKGPAAIVLMALLSAWVGLGVWGYNKVSGKATFEELEALRPALTLSESEGLYLDCFLAVQGSTLLDESLRQSWTLALRDALDRSNQLHKLEAELEEMIGAKSGRDHATEVERLRQKIEETQDLAAKQTYIESLEMIESRVTKVDGAAGQLERIEANIELTRQTFLRTKDMLRSMNVEHRQAIQVDLEPLRTNLNKVQADAKLVIAAIEEMNQC